MKKYGVEVEYFVEDPKEGVQIIPNLNMSLATDEFPILGEVRSYTREQIYLAIADIEWQLREIEEKLAKRELKLSLASSTNLTDVMYRNLMKIDFHKGGVKEENLYGKNKPTKLRLITAGTHIHFSDGTEVGKEEKRTLYVQLDIPKMVRQLDKKFCKEISEAHRQLGWYELKPHGFEYRSLPNNINLKELAQFVYYELKW
jgi:hypothetical protein